MRPNDLMGALTCDAEKAANVIIAITLLPQLCESTAVIVIGFDLGAGEAGDYGIPGRKSRDEFKKIGTWIEPLGSVNSFIRKPAMERGFGESSALGDGTDHKRIRSRRLEDCEPSVWTFGDANFYRAALRALHKIYKQ